MSLIDERVAELGSSPESPLLVSLCFAFQHDLQVRGSGLQFEL